jgi:hypothetical protein
MGLFLFRFWVALVPMAIYIVWFLLVRHRAIKNNQPLPQFRDTPLYWAILASLVVAGICFLVLGMSQKRDADDYKSPFSMQQREEVVDEAADADPETNEWGRRGNSVPSRMDKNSNTTPAQIREKP